MLVRQNACSAAYTEQRLFSMPSMQGVSMVTSETNKSVSNAHETASVNCTQVDLHQKQSHAYSAWRKY